MSAQNCVKVTIIFRNRCYLHSVVVYAVSMHKVYLFSLPLTQIPIQTGIPTPVYIHFTRTLSTIPSTTKNTAIKLCSTETILNSLILAVIAIFATQMAKPQLSVLKLKGRQSKSGVETGIDTLFMANVGTKCSVTTLTIDATAITFIKTTA